MRYLFTWQLDSYNDFFQCLTASANVAERMLMPFSDKHSKAD